MASAAAESKRLKVRTPPIWVSYWAAFSSVIVAWDAGYCFMRPRSFHNGDLAWIWGPYNAFPYGAVDLLYGQKAYDERDGFTNAQALINIIEILLNLEYLYLRHTSPHSSAPTTPTHAKRPRYHAHAALVGFSSTLMTLSKTALYFLQEYYGDWVNVAQNDTYTFWTIWVATNGTWVLVPFIVCVVLGRFITKSMANDLSQEIAYKEWAELQPVTLPSAEITVKPTQPLTSSAVELEKTAAPATSTSYPAPQAGAALPLTFRPADLPCLVIGSNRLAASRVFTLLEASSDVTVLSTSPLERAHPELRHRVKTSAVRYLHRPLSSDGDLAAWALLFSSESFALVCVTDTLIGATSRRSPESAAIIAQAATSLHIPINVSDHPLLSTFSFPATHRFPLADGTPSHLQIAVSTNGHGCRLTSRIKRDISLRLPATIGAAVNKVGELRERAQQDARSGRSAGVSEDDPETPLNQPVEQLDTPSILNGVNKQLGFKPSKAGGEEEQLRRMRWVHQMSEYYSYEALARLSPQDMDRALATWSDTTPPPSLPHHDASSSSSQQPGEIYLIGSGPGSPGLLTCRARDLLTTATLILSDKLVPSEILELIPPSTPLHIAKKFPGNNEGAQNEMMEMALAAAQRGDKVVRLKQGDPFVFGRGGEEVLFFREHGFECEVVPGISSAIAGPEVCGIPVTQRGVAESFVVCTGVGRAGKSVKLPGYVRSRSLVLLMGVARIGQIVRVLTSSDADGEEGRAGEKAYPAHLPVAVIERASSPDQRIVKSTLGGIEEALKGVGEERPPGMIIVGWSVLALEGKGRVDVLDTLASKAEGEGEEIVEQWLGGETYKVEEGLKGSFQ